MCGCYVDAEKNKVVKFGQTFLNLEDEEFYKYLEIAKKVLSGNIGNNLLTLDIPLEEESAGGRQQAEDTLAQMMEQWEALSCELEDAT